MASPFFLFLVARLGWEPAKSWSLAFSRSWALASEAQSHQVGEAIGGVAEPTLISVHGDPQASCFQNNQTWESKLSPDWSVRLLTTPTREYVSLLPSVTEVKVTWLRVPNSYSSENYVIWLSHLKESTSLGSFSSPRMGCLIELSVMMKMFYCLHLTNMVATSLTGLLSIRNVVSATG